MKKFKILFLLCTWVVLAFAGACGGSDEDTITQDEIDALFADAAQNAEDEAASQSCTTTCAELEAGLSSPLVEGTFDCPGGGTFTVVVGTCDANGTIQVTVTFNNCDDSEGNVLNGSATANITVSAASTTVVISSSGLEANGFTLSSNNATITVSCINGVTDNDTCSGSVTVDGATCTLDTDCSGCTL